MFNGKALAKAGRNTVATLKERSPTAAFNVVPVAEAVGRDGSVCCFPRWRLGNLYIRGRPAAAVDSTSVHVSLSSAGVPGLLPAEALLGLAQALPFGQVLESLLNAVRAPADTFSESFQMGLTDALLSGVVASVADGAYDAILQSTNVNACLNTLAAWAAAVELHVAMTITAPWARVLLIRALGTLSALADVIHSIFSSRRRDIANRMRCAQYRGVPTFWTD